MRKKDVSDFAIFGGAPVFSSVRPISNLVRPDIEKFFHYSKIFCDPDHFSDGRTIIEIMEQRLAEFHEVRHCVAVNGGFWALVLAIKCLALPDKTEVVMPALTYRRLADCVAWAGLTPRFCEVDADRLCITAETARACINQNTALILGVHPIVNCCDADGLESLSVELGIPLMFDAVESVYETYKGRKVGGFGSAECFSVEASKLLNGFEGGYITTNNDVLAERLRAIRQMGFSVDGQYIESGIHAGQIDVHAAMTLASLDGVDEQVILNRRRYESYLRGFASISQVRLLRFDDSNRHGFKNIVVELLDDWPFSREQTLRLLHAENMLCRAYYWPALHKRQVGYAMLWDDLSRTEALSERFLLLPCGYFVSDLDALSVCEFMADLIYFQDEIKSFGTGVI